MRTKALIFLLYYSPLLMNAQINEPVVAGTYYLKNQRETAAGFQLKQDGKFEFFFSYGALDRQSAGTWKQSGDSILFQSQGDPQKDFLPGENRKVEGSSIRISLLGGNPGINSFFKASVTGSGVRKEATANSAGEFYFEIPRIDSIELRFEWCPEKVYRYKVPNPESNHFTFTVQPSILDVFFNSFKMKLSRNKISGSLPFSDATVLEFEKQE